MQKSDRLAQYFPRPVQFWLPLYSCKFEYDGNRIWRNQKEPRVKLADYVPFLKKKQVFLGLDISSSAVKLLELSEHNHRFRVESFAVEPLPANAVVEKTIVDVESVGETIRKALRRANTKINKV